MEYETPSFTSNKSLNIIMTWLFIVTVLLLFTPFSYFAPNLAAKIAPYKDLLYIALIVEVSNFLSLFIINKITSHKQKKYNKQMNEFLEAQVQSLDFTERALLREFVLQRKSVLTLPIDEPVVNSLLQSKILVPTSECANEDNTINVMISKLARPYITYKAIGLTKGKMTDEMLDQLMQSRPDFARETKVMQKSYRGGSKAA